MEETGWQDIVVDFGKICRLCLTGDGVLISLFSTDSFADNGNKSVPDRIMELMSISVIYKNKYSFFPIQSQFLKIFNKLLF